MGIVDTIKGVGSRVDKIIDTVSPQFANRLDSIIDIFNPELAYKRGRYREARLQARAYEGAAKNRRTQYWKASSTSANTENSLALETLRNRAREQVRNNPYANRIVSVIPNNVVGKGIVANISAPSPELSQRAQNLWNQWAGTTACDYDCKLNFAGIQNQVMRSCVEAGEVLVRIRRTTDDFPLKLQILEADHIATNRVFSRNEENGNRIVNGIEIDEAGCPVAYHLYINHPGNIGSEIQDIRKSLLTVRVPANEIMHVFRKDRPGQLRGVTWLHPVMIRLREIDEFEDAQLVKQKISACFSAFIKDIETPDQESNNEFDLEKLEPGIVEYLPPGKDITFASPPLPNSDSYKFYMAANLRSVAAGVGITYEALTGDYSEVNFSSARMGDLQFRSNVDNWQQNIVIPDLCSKTFDVFKATAILLGEPFDEATSTWTVPRRDMIDPTKEIPAKIKAIRAGIETLSDSIRQNGKDPQKHFEEIKSDNDTIDSLELTLDSDPRKTAASGAIQDDGETQEAGQE